VEAKAKPKRETWAGVTMIGIGLIVIFESLSYNIGDAARMGPGYFPLLLGRRRTAYARNGRSAAAVRAHP